MQLAKNKKRRIGVGVATLATLAAFAVLATSAPHAQASQPKPVASTAGAIRSAGGKVVLTVDGQVVKAGQVVKGREVEARITLPSRVKLAKPTTVSLVDYQTTTFELATSDQRFLQADSTRLLPGRTTVLKLGLRCQLKVGKRCAGKLYKHQLDVVVGAVIGADQPFKWLGTYPRYTGKQLLAGGFAKARCRPVHGKPKPCKKCHRKEG